MQRTRTIHEDRKRGTTIEQADKVTKDNETVPGECVISSVMHHVDTPLRRMYMAR